MDEATPPGAVSDRAVECSAEEEEEQESRLNEGTTGGPSSKEIATQVSLSLIGPSHGEPTVSAISVETVPNEGYCDGATVLSIDEVLGHALSASPSSAPSLSERLGVVMWGYDTADSCRLSTPLVGLDKSPSHPVYKLSFRAVEAIKAAKNVVANQFGQFALVQWGQRSLVPPLLHNHQYHLAQQLQHREPDFTAPSISHTDSILSANFLSTAKGVVTESRLLLRFFEAVRSVGQASDEHFRSTARKTPPSHGSATPTTSAMTITGTTPTTGSIMPLTGVSPTTGAVSQVVGGIIGSRDSERSQGSSEPDCSCATLAWPLAEFGAEPADGRWLSRQPGRLGTHGQRGRPPGVQEAILGRWALSVQRYSAEKCACTYTCTMCLHVHVRICTCTCTPVLYSSMGMYMYMYMYT